MMPNDHINDSIVATDLFPRSGAGNPYPNQFFDMSQAYMPPNIKELFKWCTFYYYNSPLIGSALKKVARYPITDLIIEDESEKIRVLWDNILNKTLKIKNVAMEINLDYFVYGNAFLSMHFPFSRYLICRSCNKRFDVRDANWTFQTNHKSEDAFKLQCSCGHHGPADLKDVQFKNKNGVRLIRWNPENISIKYNEYTGNYTYLYTVPAKLKRAIQAGDKDIVSDLPKVVIDAVVNNRMIRLNPDRFKHLKMPTLAEKDSGWGKPLIIHVLKDMWYFYTLRRAQEAIALEHIVPLDVIYPMPNAQQDPYMHADLGSWRNEVRNIVDKHRRDPNFKGISPVPVGFARMGGDGKMMLMGPELQYLTQTIVGGMGLPQEFLFGGLNWTGSSVSLRTLENDFIQNRTQLLDVVNWIISEMAIMLDLPKPKSVKFSDFRMADDIQRNQQLIGLNAQKKISDQTMLTELGYDYEQEKKKMIEEAYLESHIEEIRQKGAARASGESMMIQNNYQKRMQELAQQAQAKAQARVSQMGFNQVNIGEEVQAVDPQAAQQDAPQTPPPKQPEVDMSAMPEKNIPRRQGSV